MIAGSLASGLAALLERRSTLISELAAVNEELDEVRRLLGPAVAPVVLDAWEGGDLAGPLGDQLCQRCGRRFTPGPGAAGKYCSGACCSPAGLTIEERRERILAALAAGPQFVSTLQTDPTLADIGRGTIRGDMQALRREGKVASSEQGWMLVGASDPVLGPAVAPPMVTPQPPRPAPSVLRAKDGEPAPRTVDAPSRRFPERRCGRCMYKFTPTMDRQYVCPKCVTPVKVKALDPDPELEPAVATRNEDTPAGFGSTLSGIHKVHR